MARFDYGRMANTATRLLDRFQQGVVTLTRPGVPGPPPNDWTPGEPGEDVVIPLKATVKGVSKEFIDGTTVLATDLEVTASDFGSDVDPADVMTIDGKAVTVVQTKRIPAAGTLVCWKFIVRG